MSGSGSGSVTTDINSIFLGEVASVQTYGAFVKIPGSSNQGLVHRTQISKVNVPDVSDVLAKNDRVWCKVISTTDDGKIALSMKVVDQGSGKDLDPNGVQIKLDEQRRKEWVPGEKRKVISLDAVYNTTCSRCSTRGHLSKDCFQVAGGKTYELIPEDDTVKKSFFAAPQNTAMEPEAVMDKKERKKVKKAAKKLKKEAKKKKKAAKKLKKKMKKEAKKAKKHKSKEKKHSSSEDSSDSSDSSSSSSDSECEQSVGRRETQNKEKATYKRDSSSHFPRDHTSHSRERSRSRSPMKDSKSSRSNSFPIHHRSATTSQESSRKSRV